MVDNIKLKIQNSVFAKGKHTKTKIIIAGIISLLISIFLVVYRYTKIWDVLPIFSIVIFFISVHFIFKVKDIYGFIYKYRFLLALLVFTYIVIMGYSGSSIGIYKDIIQSSDSQAYYSPILGKSRVIRGDEWNVNTPLAISQSIDKDSPFGYYNDNLRGTKTEMFSVASAPVADVMILAKPFFVGFLLFGAEHGLAFMWYGKEIALMLISFELCMLISNKKKLISLFGMILVVFSSATQWFFITDFVIWGGLALILFDKFMTTNTYKIKILCALGIFISVISYIFILYPAWQLTYGYTLIPILIWIIWKNNKQYKMNYKDMLIILAVIILSAAIGIRYYSLSKDVLYAVSNTDYPGERFILGGGGETTLFSYIYSVVFPYINKLENPCELAGMYSLYPIPTIIAFIFMLRNKTRRKHFAFILPALIVSVLLSIWAFVPTNRIFAKITLLYMVPANRVVIPLGFMQIILMVYIMGNIEKEDVIIKNVNIAKVLAVILSIAIMMIAINTDKEEVMGNLKSYVFGLILLVETYALFTINKDNSQKLLITVALPIALLSGITVNPVQKGISVITNKPVAKEVQKIVSEDPDNNLWLSELFPDYFLASGARVLNSVNTYPNFDMYKTILKDKFEQEEYRKIYNRYAHVYMQVTDKESTVELLYMDAVRIKVNAETIKELGVKYIIEREDIEKYETKNVDFEKIYDEDGIMIFKVNY